jgi:acetylornithine deacetylase/succinyl-diaminopimelate desuccinylase-like protein
VARGYDGEVGGRCLILLARLPGRWDGPSLAFLGHLDVVHARREDWTVEPFAAVEHSRTPIHSST